MTRRALLIDFDGTLVDSLPALAVAYASFLEAHGGAPSGEEFEALNGPALPEIVAHLKAAHGLKPPLEALLRDYRARVEIAYEEAVSPRAGAHDLLREAHALGVDVHVVSAAPAPWVRRALERAGLGPVAAVHDTTGLVASKPHPAVYRRALAHAGCEASAALAAEDAPNGLAAAQRAGLRVIDAAMSLVPVVEALRELARAPDISALHLRPARVEDLAWVLSLRNLPESVAVSNRCRPLSIDELPDPFAEFARVWVAQRGDQRVGYVTATLEQVDDAPRRSLIGLVIAPESRGQGLAAQCIEAACRHLDAMGWGPVDAFVFAGNLASEAAFARAGFVPMMSALQPDGRTRRTWRREPEVASSDAP